MTAIAFPSIEPSSRSFTPGEYPRTLFESQNGAVTAIYFGHRPVNSTLEMQFNNILDAKAHDIIAHYKQCNRTDSNGNWNYALMPTSAIGPLAGIGASELRNTMGENDGSRSYRYVEAPTVTSTFPGYSTVTVKLVGMFEATNATTS